MYMMPTLGTARLRGDGVGVWNGVPVYEDPGVCAIRLVRDAEDDMPYGLTFGGALLRGEGVAHTVDQPDCEEAGVLKAVSA